MWKDSIGMLLSVLILVVNLRLCLCQEECNQEDAKSLFHMITDMLISDLQHPLPSGSGPFLRRDFLLIFAGIDNLISIYNFPFLISVQGLEILVITIT